MRWVEGALQFSKKRKINKKLPEKYVFIAFEIRIITIIKKKYLEKVIFRVISWVLIQKNLKFVCVNNFSWKCWKWLCTDFAAAKRGVVLNVKGSYTRDFTVYVWLRLILSVERLSVCCPGVHSQISHPCAERSWSVWGGVVLFKFYGFLGASLSDFRPE